MTKDRIIPCLALLLFFAGFIGGIISLAIGYAFLGTACAAVVIASAVVFLSTAPKAI